MFISQIEHTVAFTGHRTYRAEVNDELRRLLEELYSQGYRTFLSGMACGFDVAAAEAVIELRERCPDVELVAVVPFVGFRNMFRGEDLARYDAVMDAADRQIVVSDMRGAIGYHKRNDFLVDNASYIVAWWNHLPKGGTFYTVTRARRQHKPVNNLCPQLQMEIFG